MLGETSPQFKALQDAHDEVMQIDAEFDDYFMGKTTYSEAEMITLAKQSMERIITRLNGASLVDALRRSNQNKD